MDQVADFQLSPSAVGKLFGSMPSVKVFFSFSDAGVCKVVGLILK